ncbi:MAG: D-alanyl-D-alanine carboxypeptidase/D-alanyl-D-alanine-endopeptidase [Candidatus Cybelea sp.]|jgi:D-alanyl-D-alanine carboxypeptidase/D-alanyl-D-alanine-endopeptidase (penicillin-binding protein 4)
MSPSRYLCAIALLVTLGAVSEPQPGGTPWSDAQIMRLHQDVDVALQAPALRGAYVGLLAVDAARGTVLYARNADDEFTPGSTFKLLVGSAALQTLGADFRFVTTLSSDVPPKDGIVSGSLYLHGGGDAHLSAADLRAAALAASRAGIRRVDGAIVVDDSHYDAQRFAPGWTVDDLPYEYGALVSALELEDGVVHVYVSPGPAAGAPVKLRVEPTSGAFTVENHAVTGVAHSEDTTDVVRPFDSPQRIEIVGSYPAGATESDDLEPSVPDPALYAGDVLRRALGDAGIAVAGGVRGGVAPRGAEVFWRFESAAMPQLLSEFWLPSDNLMGDLFLKELGAARSGEPGSFTNGIAVEGDYLRSIGVDPATLSITDGSGHSAYDRITPRDLVAILQSDWEGAYRSLVIDALPEAGVRGTLKDAFAGTSLDGRVFAKTGTHRHARTLSGFIQTDDHGPVTFSLLINDWLGDDRPGGSPQLRQAQAALLSAFLGGPL